MTKQEFKAAMLKKYGAKWMRQYGLSFGINEAVIRREYNKAETLGHFLVAIEEEAAKWRKV